MEDYRRKYEMALERAKEMCAMPSDKATMEYIFPELKESEDERIRKRIYNYINVTLDDNERAEKEKWLAWLEKLKDIDKRLEEAYKTADEVQYNRGYQAAMAEMERNRLTACENQTEAEAKREMDFALGFFKKNKRQPTYSDCIEETRRKMIKEVTKWLEDNASRYIHVYWNEKEWVFEKGDLNADLKKSMGL